MYRHLTKFMKKKIIHVKYMFIINLKYIQLMNNLIITYVIIFNKDNLINQINVYLGVTIRVRGSGSCRVEP